MTRPNASKLHESSRLARRSDKGSRRDNAESHLSHAILYHFLFSWEQLHGGLGSPDSERVPIVGPAKMNLSAGKPFRKVSNHLVVQRVLAINI
jgi:hypothetical protein